MMDGSGARGRAARLVLGVVAAGAVLVGAGGSSAGAAEHPSITLYSGQHPETVSALVSAFERASGVHVDVRSDDEDVIAAQIVQEGSHSPADVFLTENTPPLEELQQRGLLSAVKASTLATVPRADDSSRGDWLGISARVSTLVYNTGDLEASQLPRSVLGLADPKWKGKLALAPTETDFQPIVTAVAARYGRAKALAWLEALKSNASGHIYPDNETLVAQVNSGRAQIGVINHYYWYRLRDEVGRSKIHSAEHFFAPRDPGYVLDVSGAGILKSSKEQAADQQFLAFLVSKRGQSILAHSESYEYPLGSGVKTAKPLFPYADLKPDPITLTQLGNGGTAVGLIRSAGLL
jgi:iron(III) transport system substrate-binding protein